MTQQRSHGCPARHKSQRPSRVVTARSCLYSASPTHIKFSSGHIRKAARRRSTTSSSLLLPRQLDLESSMHRRRAIRDLSLAARSIISASLEETQARRLLRIARLSSLPFRRVSKDLSQASIESTHLLRLKESMAVTSLRAAPQRKSFTKSQERREALLARSSQTT